MSIYMFKVKTYGNNKSCNKTFYISWKRELKAKVLLSDYTVGVLNLVVSLHSVMLALTHTIGVSNNTLSLSLSSPSLTVRPAMAWQWWESTVLYLSTCDVCLHTELLCCAPIEGNLIDSEGVRVCVCIPVPHGPLLSSPHPVACSLYDPHQIWCTSSDEQWTCLSVLFNPFMSETTKTRFILPTDDE